MSLSSVKSEFYDFDRRHLIIRGQFNRTRQATADVGQEITIHAQVVLAFPFDQFARMNDRHRQTKSIQALPHPFAGVAEDYCTTVSREELIVDLPVATPINARRTSEVILGSVS